MNLMANLAVVVVNYGSAHLLEASLGPLSDAVRPGSIVVVDNFVSPDERDRISALADGRWTTVLSDSNVGFGSGMNLGIARARSLGASKLLLLNPDATIQPDQVLILAQYVEDHPLALVAPRIIRPDGSVWFSGADLYLRNGRIRSASRRHQHPDSVIEPWLSGACLMLRTELLDRVGGFADDYFLYWEDVDLSYRVVRAGGTLAVVDDAVAIHAEGGTQGSGHERSGQAKSTVYYYYNIRNRLLFAAEHLESTMLRRWMRMAVPVAWEILLQGGRRQFLRSPRPIIAAFRGVKDGRTIARRELARRRRKENSA